MMSKVFQLRPSAESHQWLTLSRETDFDVLHDFDGLPVGAAWRPLAGEWITEGAEWRKPRSDFPVLGSTPTFSHRAVDALLDLLVPSGELLPLSGDASGLFVYNVTRVVDALDEERSTLVRFPSSNRVMWVIKHAFHPERVNGETIFKVPQIRGAVFTTEQLLHRARTARLTGFDLSEVWSESQHG
jgi:hypothetical protein